MEKFALIWLIVIASMFVGVLIAGGSIVLGFVAAAVLVSVFLGLRRLRRQRQERERLEPDSDELEEPRPGEEPLRPG